MRIAATACTFPAAASGSRIAATAGPAAVSAALLIATTISVSDASTIAAADAATVAGAVHATDDAAISTATGAAFCRRRDVACARIGAAPIASGITVTAAPAGGLHTPDAVRAFRICEQRVWWALRRCSSHRSAHA